MIGFLGIGLGVVIGGLLIFSLWAEKRGQTVNQTLAELGQSLRQIPATWQNVRARHPYPAWAWLETGLWLFFLLPLLDNALNPHNSFTAGIIWALTIIPHEAGHLLCNPFGWFMMILGGSIWQLLFWWLAGWFSIQVRGRLTSGLLAWMIAGHSFLNLSVYIRDASDRQLPLLFGMGAEHHDWWNLLRTLGLLDYDYILADMALTLGVLLALVCILCGVLTTWYLPHWRRQGLVIFPFGALWGAMTSKS